MNEDILLMLKAKELAELGRVTAPPNPWVGCVIANEGKVVGEGFHRAAGEPHAEVHALQQAKGRTQGATVYVTLEPCCHFGRTPPCTKALIEAGVSHVVVAVLDPDPKVQGKGVAELRNAGIKVTIGVASEAVSTSLAPYLYQRKTGLSYALAKAAISIDGRIAAADGSSQWITCKEAQIDSHQLRAESQAIIVGSGTAQQDLPKLTVRRSNILPSRQPLRVVLDSRGRVLPPNPLFDLSLAPTLMVTSSSCPDEVMRIWEKAGVEVAMLPKSASQIGVDLHQVMGLLGKKGMLQALIEGGSTLLGAFLEEKLIQHLAIYIGPKILGYRGVPLFRHDAITALDDSPQLNFLGSKICGTTVRIDYSLVVPGVERLDMNNHILN